ncbi:hypothetical protein ACLB2K_073297 [Fragaria x ananassa]
MEFSGLAGDGKWSGTLLESTGMEEHPLRRRTVANGGRWRADVRNYVKVRTPAQINSDGTDRQLFLLVPNKSSILSFFSLADSTVMSFDAKIELLQVSGVSSGAVPSS